MTRTGKPMNPSEFGGPKSDSSHLKGYGETTFGKKYWGPRFWPKYAGFEIEVFAGSEIYWIQPIFKLADPVDEIAERTLN